jgi:hypothetical protein
MEEKMKNSIILSILLVLISLPTLAQPTIPGKYIVHTFIDEDGNLIDEIIVPGRPPIDHREPAVELPDVLVSNGVNVLPEVPRYDWSYGCSATSGAMIAGYYDRDNGTSYPNMYSGPENGGVAPIDNTVWGSGECPLSATHQGYDGLSLRGHVDDYYDSNDTALDPYYGHWTQHDYADCTADYMGTNQYHNWQNANGSTRFYYYPGGAPVYDYTACEPDKRDGCHGLKLFFESRGYSIQYHGNFNQYIYGYNGNTQGFTYNQFKAEIDAGRPVMIQVSGHSMVGFGYNDNGGSNVVWIHDTWDHNNHTMIWGDSYSGMTHYGVSVFKLEPVVPIAGDESTEASYYHLHNVYPNPAHGTAYVQFEIPEIINVSLTVYDISGRAVTEMTYSELSPGEHEVMIDDLSAGFYIVQMQAGDFIDSVNMIIVR